MLAKESGPQTHMYHILNNIRVSPHMNSIVVLSAFHVSLLHQVLSPFRAKDSVFVDTLCQFLYFSPFPFLTHHFVNTGLTMLSNDMPCILHNSRLH